MSSSTSISVFLNLIRICITQLLAKQKFRNYYSLFNLFKVLHKMFKINTNPIPEKPVLVAPWEFELGTDQQGQEKSWCAK